MSGKVIKPKEEKDASKGKCPQLLPLPPTPPPPPPQIRAREAARLGRSPRGTPLQWPSWDAGCQLGNHGNGMKGWGLGRGARSCGEPQVAGFGAGQAGAWVGDGGRLCCFPQLLGASRTLPPPCSLLWESLGQPHPGLPKPGPCPQGIYRCPTPLTPPVLTLCHQTIGDPQAVCLRASRSGSVWSIA